MENNRSILAVALIILLWSGYSIFFAPQQPPLEVVDKEVAVEQKNKQFNSVESTSVSNTTEKGLENYQGEHVEKIITVISDLYNIKLSTSGATLRAVTLNGFKETNDTDSKPLSYIEMTPSSLATFKTSGNDSLAIPSNLPFQLLGSEGETINIDSAEKVVSFSALTASGLTVIKNYTFRADSYVVEVSVKIINDSNSIKSGNFNFSLVSVLPEEDGGGMQDMYTFVGPISFNGEELLEDDLEDLEESAKIYGEGILWSGFVTKYFLTLISPGESAKQVQIEKGDGYVQNKFISPYISLAPGQKVSFDYVSFIGPLDYDLLYAAGHQFEQAKDYGFFSILAKPLMHVLKFFYGFFGNYGVAIILLTVCIKIIFWPLTQKSYKSMKGMQKLQPEMQKLREKYSNDKQRLNQEMMSFYKENKVNPLGGCLPMLIQIPVFFALYQVLLGAIELRHAPFIFWLVDLSTKDPYYITPLIMGATMFVQQKMTPTTMDPNQAKIMLMMPVIFTFMFLNFPSGLVLYWMVNNLLTILQQYLIRRQPD